MGGFCLPKTDNGKYRMINEVELMIKGLNSLPGVKPWEFTVMTVLEKKLGLKSKEESEEKLTVSKNGKTQDENGDISSSNIDQNTEKGIYDSNPAVDADNIVMQESKNESVTESNPRHENDDQASAKVEDESNKESSKVADNINGRGTNISNDKIS